MVRAAEKAARTLVRDFGEVEQLQVSKKGPADFVSSADLAAEKTIRVSSSVNASASPNSPRTTSPAAGVREYRSTLYFNLLTNMRPSA